MTDAEIMQAVLLALTMQNVTHEQGNGYIVGDFEGIFTVGEVVNTTYIVGPVH